MGPRSVNFSEEDKVIVKKLNTLLDQLHAPNRVKTVADIGAGVFVTLFEGLCGEELPGIIRDASTREDEIHNCQVVIDSLAGDVLHTSLTHISGADIIDGGREAILNMAEIFAGLLEYMLNKIESDASTDNEEDDHNFTADPDLMTRDMIDEILEKELRRDRLEHESQAVKNSGPTARWVAESSPSRRDPDTFSMDNTATRPDITGDKDTTADLIRESQELERRLQESRRPGFRPISSVTASRPAAGSSGISARSRVEPRAMSPIAGTSNGRKSPVTGLANGRKSPVTGLANGRKSPLAELSNGRKSPVTGLANGRKSPLAELSNGRKSPVTGLANGRKSPLAGPSKIRDEGIIAERESRSDIIRRLENDPRYKYMLPPTAAQTEASDIEVDETFTNLQHMVEETAAMARAAVDCSPSRAQTMLETLDRRRRAGSPVRSRVPNQRPQAGMMARSRRDQANRMQQSSGRTAKRASPSAPRASQKPADKHSDTELTPSKAKNSRKVSFLVERSNTDSSPSFDAGVPSAIRKRLEERRSPVRERKSVRSGKTTTAGAASGSYLSDSMYSDKENKSYEDRLRMQYNDIVADVLSEKSPERDRRGHLVSSQKALYTVGDTKQLVQREKEDGRRKIGFLQKIYREDLDELLDEADYLMDKNRQAAKDTEKEYQKKMLTGVKTKPIEQRQAPSVLKKTKKTLTKPCVSTKAKKSLPSRSVLKAQNKPLTIKDDEDILPMLLDEFPHLHLSVSTWHELWRKGLTQIEQLTRAHQEVRRKKSVAHNQLEEAEQRQQIMVNIMKKELEHSQRLREIKDQKATAISTQNKLHERRMQSARSRHYYDEYQVRMRSKMLKRRTREEMVFKKLFKDGLDIQKERIRELRNYAREQRDTQASTQRNEIESLENHYRDQFQMLAENIAKEKEDLAVQQKAQQKVLGTMKKDLRKKMETEIKHLQEHLVRDDDDAYFRQLDADRVIHDLKMAKYQVRM